MNLTRWSLLVFVIAAVLCVVMLMAVPLPYLGERGIDPRTGKRLDGPEVILYPWLQNLCLINLLSPCVACRA